MTTRGITTLPADTKAFIMIGQSGMGGHDKLSKAPPHHNRQSIYRLEGNGTFTQDPPHPFRSGAGVSPAYYFADRYIALAKAPSVCLISSGGPDGQLGNWHDGVTTFGQKAAAQAAGQMAQAVAAGATPGGLVSYCCEGDADTDAKIDAFPERWKNLMDRYRSALGVPTLPFVLTLIAKCNSSGDAAYKARIIRLRLVMANISKTGLYTADAGDLPLLGKKGGCFHCTASGQKTLGIRMADAMP